MAFHVRDPETDRLVRELARRKGIGLTEAIKLAVREKLSREPEPDADARYEEMRRRLDELQRDILSNPPTGLEADKAFYDSLYDEAD